MSLVLVALAALAQAGLARKSLLLASDAIHAQTELQHRWGTISCRQLLLENAQESFLQIEEQHKAADKPYPLPAQVTGQVILGQLTFAVVLSDEEAKANINTLQARLPTLSRQLTTELSGSRLPINFQPNMSPQASQTKRWYTGWGQVFLLRDVLTIALWEPLLEATSRITCWGSGKVNIKRGSDDLLERIISQTIDAKTARQFLELRRESDQISLENLLSQLSLRRTQATKLRGWLTDKSQCFSLWIQVANREHKQYHFFVMGDRGANADLPYLAFHW